ncbi:MAG: hypothetical protein CMK95_00575 [Pseudomonas sp.]|nr:hypothetical protein [Pseudomonas sp.]|tara:strand:+ start:417 stop:1067 length:651 start_codon:yes stop_codon:yes gene_type:complete
MKNLLLGLIISVLSIPAFAGSINGNVGYDSDYVWRGVTQSRGLPSVHFQGEVLSDLGFYVGTYMAQVEFEGDDETSKEVDWYAGYDLQVSDNVSLDSGYIRYTYDGLADTFEELYTQLNVGGFSTIVYHDINTDNNYAELSYEFGWLVGNVFDLKLIHGIHDLEDGDEDFTQLQVGKSFGAENRYNFSVTVGTDVFEGQAADSVFASLTYNFDRGF